MEIKFQTKEESNQQQQEAFLKLSGAERIKRFLRLARTGNKNVQDITIRKPNNFVIQKNRTHEILGR